MDADLTSSSRVLTQHVATTLGFEGVADEWALRGKNGWLNPDLSVQDQWVPLEGALLFRKKYFLSDAALPKQCRERLLLFYQARQQLSQGVYVCTNLEYVHFAGLAAQQRFGDCDPAKHTKATVHEFLPEPLWSALEGHTLDAWSGLNGMSSDDAVYEFTHGAQADLSTYGVSRFPVTEPAAHKDKSKRDLGVTQSFIFRIQDNIIVEQIRLEDLRTWNFSPKSIEFEFLPGNRDKYVANTTRGREILALLSEYQYFNRTRGGVSDSVKVNIQLSASDQVRSESVQVDIATTARHLITQLLEAADQQSSAGLSPACFSLRSASRWLTSDEKLGGLREPEVWLVPGTDLHQAAEEGNVAQIPAALERDCPVNAIDLEGNTALHLAMAKGHKLFVLRLLELPNCDPCATNLKGERAIGELLDLSSCGIVRLPASVSACTELRSVDLSHNLLVTLPAEFGSFLHLKKLYLDGNPLPGIPVDVVKGGAELVREYLANMSKIASWNRCKVVICGAKRSGKTTLARLVVDPDRQLISDRTLGLSISDGHVGDLDICVYDVCGDESFRTAEPLLYSDKAVYCIVTPLSASSAELVGAQIFAINSVTRKNPPVIVAASFLDECSPADRKVWELDLASAVKPYSAQLVAKSPAGIIYLDPREDSSRDVVQEAIEVGFGKLTKSDFLVPQSYQCLHLFIGTMIAREKQSSFHKLTEPPLGAATVHNFVYDHVAASQPSQEPTIGSVGCFAEFEKVARDSFVPKGNFRAAAQFLQDVGSVIVTGEWIILDPAAIAARVYDLFALRGTTLYGVVPYSVLRSLWPDVRATGFTQLIATLESLDLVANFADQSFIFVPALVIPQKPSRSWPSSVFVPKYVSEWRLSECTVPERFNMALLARMAQFSPIEAVWARGFVLKVEKLHLRVEISSSKIVLTCASKLNAKVAAMGTWARRVAQVVTTLLEAPEFRALSWERFVRALTMKKPALIRYTDLLKFEANGNKAVAVQGASVSLDLLLPPAEADVDSQPTATTQSAPSAWRRAASVSHLLSCFVVCAETYRLVRNMDASIGVTFKPIAEDSRRLNEALEHFGLQTAAGVSGFNACRSIMIEGARQIIAALESMNWSADILAAAQVKVFAMAGAIYASDLGLPMDEPSSKLVCAVAGKFGCVCSLLGRWVEESNSLGLVVKARGRNLNARVASLQALIETAVTLEACLLLETTCQSDGSA